MNEVSQAQKVAGLGKIAFDYINSVVKDKKIDKILFVNPPDVDETLFDLDVAKRGRANNYPAYGLGVLATKLNAIGYSVEICNLNHEILKWAKKTEDRGKFDFISSWQQILSDVIKDFKPDIVGVTCTFSVTHQSFKKVCDFIKDCDKETPILIGGVHVTHDIENILKNIRSADFAITNEAENALPIFLDVINKDRHYDDLCQFAFLVKNNFYFIKNSALPENSELDLVPAYEKLDVSSHSTFGTVGAFQSLLRADTKIATVQSNRGCRAACTFCNVRTFHGKGVRQRSVESVIDELKLLNHSYGIKHIVWLDDDLLKNERRAIDLFNSIIKNNLEITWDATNGVIAKSLHNIEVVDAAEKSGCIGLNIGIESGNPDILRQIRKPGTVDTFLKASEILAQFKNINSRALLIIGFPNETFRMIFDTIKLAEQMNLDWNNLSILQPWKNTPIYDQMTEQGLLGDIEGTLKTDDNNISPYQLGIYSRQRAIEKGLIEQSVFGEKQGTLSSFLSRIDISNLDDVPESKFLDDLWFYMNVRLNFARLMREKRPEKLNQQYKFLKYVSAKTAPDNAFILYFLGYLEKELFQVVSKKRKIKLSEILHKSSYWRSRFDYFDLSLEQFQKEKFPNRIVTGGMPLNFSEKEQDLFDFPIREII